MTNNDVIEIIKDVTRKDFGRSRFPEGKGGGDPGAQ